MRIICPRCGTEYSLEADSLDREGTPVQCSSCEHVFTVFAGEQAAGSGGVSRQRDVGSPVGSAQALAAPPGPSVAEGASTSLGGTGAYNPTGAAAKPQGLYLAQGDRIYKVKDLSTLQRWVVEKRVLPSDRLSPDGKTWDVVSQRPDLLPFFAVLDQLKAARRALQRARDSGALATADPATALETVPPQAASQVLSSATIEPRTSSSPAGARPQSRPASGSPAAPRRSDWSRDGGSARASNRMGSDPAGQSEGLSETGGEDADSSLFAENFDDRAAESLDVDRVDKADEEGTVRAFIGTTRDVPVEPSNPRPTSAPVRESRPQSPLRDPEPVSIPASARAERNWDRTPVQPVGRASTNAAVGSASSSAVTGAAPVASAPDAGLSTSEFSAGVTGDGRFYVVVVIAAMAAIFLLWFFLAGPGGTSSGTPAVASLAGTPQAFQAVVEPASTPAEASPDPVEVLQPTPVVPVESVPMVVPKVGPTPAPQPKAESPRAEATPAAPRVAATVPSPGQEKAAPPKRTDVAGTLANADRARSRGDFATAAKLYEQVLSSDASSFPAALQKGWCHVELGEAGHAAASFRNALGIRPGSAEAHYGLGLAYQDLGKSAEARSEYEKVIELDPAGRDAAEVRALLHQLGGG